MAFDGITVAALAQEFKNKFTDGRLYKIAQTENDELTLTIKNGKDQYKLLISANASLPLTFLRTTSIHRRDRRSCRGYYRRRPFCRRKSFGRREGLPGKFLESVVVVKNDDFGNFFAAKSLRGIERKTTPRGFRIFERGGHRRGVCRRRGILYLKIFVGKGRPRRGSFRGSLGGLFGRIFRLLKVE